jgi:hypothetical protein
MRVAMIGVAIALVSSTPALSSPSCMTQSEARAKFPKEHLWWHGTHCWDATPPSRQRLAQRIKRQPKQEVRAEREPPEEKEADEKRKAGWSNETRWREAMSRMRAEDVIELPAPARATAGVDPVPVDASPPPSPPRMNWGERWVDIAQHFPPLPGKTGPADLTADAREAEPLVTPIRVMLALLVLLLTLGAFELARRPSRRAD